ncbi:MAG: hypothetical protein AAFN92_23645, partial [Bacteroidota bacterium]
AEREAELLEAQQEMRRRRDEQLAEIRRNNEERLADLRAREAELDRDKSVDYETVIGQLQEEGLLPSGKFRKLYFDNDTLKFNGKKASKAAHARMLDIIDDKYGRRSIGKDFKVTVSKS